MYLPKTDIYNSLKELDCFVSQTKPAVFDTLPAVIFRVGNNNVNLDLDNIILSQDLEIIIDIWAEDSVTASNILSKVEEIMRKNNYKLSFSNDVPEPSDLFHINSRFIKII